MLGTLVTGPPEAGSLGLLSEVGRGSLRDMKTVIAATYPQIVGTFAQGYPGYASTQMTVDEGDRRQVVFHTHPVGSFVDGFPLDLGEVADGLKPE